MANVRNWTVNQLDDLTGKIYFITGANSGIGFEAAAHLRRANANLLVGARSPEKGKAAVAELAMISAPGSVDLVQVDLADTSSIRAASDAVHALTDGLDGMINNAGIMQTPEMKTADGFEMQFGTNHLGHFLLNHLVFDLVKARAGRIVPVSSIAHSMSAGIDFDDPMMLNGYSATKAYSQSKLANIMYGLDLARRLEAAGSDVISVVAHPGYSATNLRSTGPSGLFSLFYKFTNLFAQSAADGAVPEVLAAAGNEAKNGAYYGPTRFGDSRGPVGDSTIDPKAKDEAAAAKLWALSEELLGITWTVS